MDGVEIMLVHAAFNGTVIALFAIWTA